MRIASAWQPVPLAIIALTGAGLLLAAKSEGYTPFVLALVALSTVVGVGLNILVGLTGQISLGHVGFYAIGAYTAAIFTLKGVDFWLAFPLAGMVAGAVGLVLALPALRVSGPYLAMLTIAFAFVVQHGTIEWRALTGGANGLLGLPSPARYDPRHYQTISRFARRLFLTVAGRHSAPLSQGDPTQRRLPS
jgi:branched-chain amino acid transport system ATP-binding protein